MLRLFSTRKLAILLALALFASLAPKTADATPKAVSSAMAMDGMMMNCHEQMPMPDHKMPCDDRSTCLGMLGCAMLALPPVTVAPAEFLFLQSSWPPQAALDGLVRRPALPPPIV
jgi:hypothetical protein